MEPEEATSPSAESEEMQQLAELSVVVAQQPVTAALSTFTVVALPAVAFVV
ncbi:hypothetical protein [Photobacterium sanguinicancri]|uniref:Uncharacterized protein n=1 Tax=Photobacterium sanguinicancri TaxID=875932 RepID=A0AAW7Y1I0_9GAMM|nr:hypothetical protein [Photobacterium sanguinicancri]MDO6541168.1 hypothetical protein [Photobacterium sanguinicancri]